MTPIVYVYTTLFFIVTFYFKSVVAPLWQRPKPDPITQDSKISVITDGILHILSFHPSSSSGEVLASKAERDLERKARKTVNHDPSATISSHSGSSHRLVSYSGATHSTVHVFWTTEMIGGEKSNKIRPGKDKR
ncbi:hypothetical protein PCASD_16055 [Puccinia coronata f. sp. avenae]|uniref:Uncharacterized protein n=2 Tax=Puccinia coronata f. sp. avenae TaxID=200324 RepID=A0A2N5TZY3_9BASI|nr:hypothetical protein PCASD_16055 [Puccinia coronata f. sp. avenae]